MKKMTSFVLAVVVCLAFCCSVYADDFVGSPGQNPTTGHCDHENCERVDSKDASCTEEGYTGDLVCTECGTVVEEGQVIAKTEHVYGEDGVCTVCGHEGTPETGDSTDLGLWIGMMAVAVVGLAAVVVIYNKKFAGR